MEGAKGSDADLRAIVAQLLAQPTVYRVATEGDVPARLASLGVRPDAAPAAPSSVVPLHRADDATGTDYYFLYNQGFDPIDASTTGSGAPSVVYEDPSACRTTGTAVSPCRATGGAFDQQVTLKGTGTPYLMDTRIGGDHADRAVLDRQRHGDGPHQAGPGRDDHRRVDSGSRVSFGAAPPRHVVSATADSAAVVGGTGLVVRASRPGTYTATLSDGTTTTATIADVPAPIDLTGATWQLAAEDWLPANPITTTGQAGSAVVKSPVNVTLNGLKPWPDIPELARASGVGTYTTTVTRPSSWKPGSSAILSLGQVQDTVKVTVNGNDVPVDQISGDADVGPYLEAGANALAVRVATTLNNRLSHCSGGGDARRHRELRPRRAGRADAVRRGGRLCAESAPGTVEGTVPATLSLSLGPAASFGAFTPGVAKDYTAQTTANVISTAGDAALSFSDPGHLTNGPFALPEPLQVTLSKTAWTGPVSNDTVTIGFHQHIGSTDPLRTGAYSKTLTFTLSTTTPYAPAPAAPGRPAPELAGQGAGAAGIGRQRSGRRVSSRPRRSETNAGTPITSGTQNRITRYSSTAAAAGAAATP